MSGLALGIDGAAHEGALRGRRARRSPWSARDSIASIRRGIARLRTRSHRAAACCPNFRPGTPPRKENFPRRNRLISGLSRGVLVVEATLSSGSLITARLAGDQGREVFAIPGSIHSPFSKGCHSLIREGAKLVETARGRARRAQVRAGHASAACSACRSARRRSRTGGAFRRSCARAGCAGPRHRGPRYADRAHATFGRPGRRKPDRSRARSARWRACRGSLATTSVTRLYSVPSVSDGACKRLSSIAFLPHPSHLL